MTTPRPWSTSAAIAAWVLAIALVGFLIWIVQIYLGGHA